MSLNAQSGIFTIELLTFVGVAGWVLYKLKNEGAESLGESVGAGVAGAVGGLAGGVADELEGLVVADENRIESLYHVMKYESEIDDGPPKSNWTEDDYRDYTEAAQYIKSHPGDFTAERVSKANDWIAYRNSHPDAGHTLNAWDVIQNNVNVIRGAYPVGDANDKYRKDFTSRAAVVVGNMGDYPSDVFVRASKWDHWVHYPLDSRPVDPPGTPLGVATISVPERPWYDFWD